MAKRSERRERSAAMHETWACWRSGAPGLGHATRPLVLWIPDTPPREVTHLTSHLDILPTILPRLGVTNPPEDYCQGFDLLGDKTRLYAVLADWNSLVYVDAHYKAVFSLDTLGLGRQIITRRDDVEVEDRAAFYQAHQAVMFDMMKGMEMFSR